MNKPFYQRALTWGSFILLGIIALGSVLDAFSNALTIITPEVTYTGSVIVLAIWVSIEVILKVSPMRWVLTAGQDVRLKSFGTKPRFALLGIILLLWFPRLIDYVKPHRKPDPVPNRIYRVRITTLDPQGMPLEDSRVWSTISGELKQIAGGWELDIPFANAPLDGRFVIYASKETAFLSGQQDVLLGDNLNPSITIHLKRDVSASIRGLVIDQSGHAVSDARVSVVGYENESVITQAGGNFVLPAHASIDQQVLLRIEKEGFKPVSQWHPAGEEPATIVLERR